MKPHTLSLLKCLDCAFTVPLNIKINKSQKLPYTKEDVLLIKKAEISILELFSEENIKNLDSTELYSFKGDINDVINVYETLLCNYIEEGELLCTGCNKKYKIEGGIVDFMG